MCLTINVYDIEKKYYFLLVKKTSRAFLSNLCVVLMMKTEDLFTEPMSLKK